MPRTKRVSGSTQDKLVHVAPPFNELPLFSPCEKKNVLMTLDAENANCPDCKERLSKRKRKVKFRGEDPKF
jgi:hypothetical protein